MFEKKVLREGPKRISSSEKQVRTEPTPSTRIDNYQRPVTQVKPKKGCNCRGQR